MTGAIVFFDGECGLCHRAVRWVRRVDRRGVVSLAPLQGETARRLLAPPQRENLQTVVLWIDGQTWERSQAVLKTLELCGGFWAFAARVAGYLPHALSDRVYGWVARNRSRWFGQAACPLPGDNEPRLLP